MDEKIENTAEISINELTNPSGRVTRIPASIGSKPFHEKI